MVTFKVKELKNIIRKCARFSTTKGMIPEYGYFSIGESIVASDGIIGIKYKNPVIFSEDFVFPSELFSRVLSSVEDEDAKVDLIRRGDHTFFKTGNFQWKIPNTQVEEHNMFEVNVPPDDVKIPIPDGLVECLKQILFSVSGEIGKIKESLRGVFYDGKYIYGSDNIMLSRIKFDFGQATLFFPIQILEHLVEDTPLAYCKTEVDGGPELLWFWFKDYVTFVSIKDIAFPMGPEIFNKILSEKINSIVFRFDENTPKALEGKDTARIYHLAEHNNNRVNIIAFKDELVFYTLLPSGMDAIEFFPIASNIPEGQKAEFVAVNIKFFKDELEHCEDFFFTQDFIYFSNKSGLESILKPLGVEDGVLVTQRAEEYKRERDGESLLVGTAELDTGTSL